MTNFTSYMLGRSTAMTSKLWNLTMVTVRETTGGNEDDKDILEKELSNLWYKITVIYLSPQLCMFQQNFPPKYSTADGCLYQQT